MNDTLQAPPAAKTRFMRLQDDPRLVPVKVMPEGASAPKLPKAKPEPVAAPLSPTRLHEADAHRVATLTAEIARARDELAMANVAISTATGTQAIRKARRAKGKAKRDLDAAEVALLAEQNGEAAAAAVRRADVVQDGIVLREAQIEVVGRRAHLMPALERLFRREAISLAEYVAGRRYCEAFEAAGVDAYPIGLGGDGGRSAPQSGNRRVEDGVGSARELRLARLHIGKFGTGMLDDIAIEGISIMAWAEKKGQSEHVCKGMLKMVLIRLSEFWPIYDTAPKNPLARPADER